MVTTSMSLVGRWLLVAGAGFLMDMFSVVCFHYTHRNRPYIAALFSVCMTGSILFVYVDAVKEPAIAIPYLVGVFFGGAEGVKLKVRLERRCAASDSGGTGSTREIAR